MRNDGGDEGGVKRGESMKELKALREEAKELKNESMKTLILNMRSSLNNLREEKKYQDAEVQKELYEVCVFKNN